MIETLNKNHETVNYKDIQGIRLYHNRKTDSFPAHWHKEAEIIMPLSNTYGIQVGLSGQVHQLTENDIIVVAPYELHTIYAPDWGERLIIDLDFLPFMRMRGINATLNALHPCKIISQAADPALFAELRRILLAVEAEYQRADSYSEAAIHSLFTDFFVRFSRSSTNPAASAHGTRDREQYIRNAQLFADICYYTNEHCTEAISLESVAAHFNFSKFHFCRLFKDTVGCTFHDYLTDCRLSCAQRQLLSTSAPVTDIALTSGFSSLATFNRVFRNKKNCTPSQFRALAGAGNPFLCNVSLGGISSGNSKAAAKRELASSQAILKAQAAFTEAAAKVHG